MGLTLPLGGAHACVYIRITVVIIGRSRGVPLAHTPNRIHFFRFCIHFCQKVYASEVGTPQWEILDPPLVMAHVPPCGKINSINIHCKWQTQGQSMHTDIKFYSISVIPVTLRWPLGTKVPHPVFAPCITTFQMINVLL